MKEDVFVYQTAKKNPRKYLHSVGDGETVEFDIVDGGRVWRQQICQAQVEVQCKAENMQQTVTIIDALHVAGVLHAVPSRITRIVQVGKEGGLGECS